MKTIMKWLTYSGLSVSITFNPLHWRWIPTAGRYTTNEWPDGNVFEVYATWLFFNIRLWIDDGRW